MRSYRAVWALAGYLTAALGAVVALVTLPLSRIAEGTIMGATVSCIAYYVVSQIRSTTVSTRQVWTIGFLGAAGWATTQGMVELIGPVGILVPVTIALTFPPAIAWSAVVLRITLNAVNPPPGPELTESLHPLETASSQSCAWPDPAQSLSDPALCQAWRVSYTLLQRTHDVTEQARLVHTRQQYLDELERRNPTGFARWLAAGARPASDPTKYMHP